MHIEVFHMSLHIYSLRNTLAWIVKRKFRKHYSSLNVAHEKMFHGV